MHRIPAFRALLAHPSPPRADFVALLADGNLAYFVGTDARGRRFELIRIGHQRAYLHSSSGQPFHVLAASQIARHAISTGYFGATSVNCVIDRSTWSWKKAQTSATEQVRDDAAHLGMRDVAVVTGDDPPHVRHCPRTVTAALTPVDRLVDPRQDRRTHRRSFQRGAAI